MNDGIYWPIVISIVNSLIYTQNSVSTMYFCVHLLCISIGRKSYFIRLCRGYVSKLYFSMKDKKKIVVCKAI